VKKETTSNYLAYLLRLWRDNETAPWRATVEDARTGKSRSFANLKVLVAFLEKRTGVVLLPDEDEETILQKQSPHRNKN